MMNLDKMSPVYEPVQFDCAVTACHIHTGKNKTKTKPFQWTEPVLKTFCRVRRKILSQSFLLKKGLIKLSLIYEQEPFHYVQWELDQALTSTALLSTKETFCPHLSLICKEDCNYRRTNTALLCNGLQRGRSITKHCSAVTEFLENQNSQAKWQ